MPQRGTLETGDDARGRDVSPWRRVLWQFRSVKVIRLERDAILDIVDSLEPKDGDSEPAFPDFLPSLEDMNFVRTT